MSNIQLESGCKAQHGGCVFEDGGWCHGCGKEVLWSITGRCNYRCRHCFMSSPLAKFEEQNREQLLDIVSQIAECGIRRVSITGGEPLVSPHLFDIITELTKRKTELSMIHTNGALVTEGFLDSLEKINVHPAFQISFDGIGWHDWMRGIPGAEKAALDSIKLLTERNYSVGITMVLHRHNIGVVNETINLLKDSRVSHIKMHVATPSGLWANETQHFITSDEANQQLCDSIIPEFFENGAGIGVQFGTLLEYFPETGTCTVPWLSRTSEFACSATRDTVYISPEGYVLPCMHLAGTAIQSAFDNIHNKPLKEILKDSNYCKFENLKAQDVISNNEKCRDCRYAVFCKAGCRANACGESGTDYLGIDNETCDFFQHGWYEKAVELCSRYSKK